MALTSRVWGAGKVLVLLAALGATYLLSAFLSARIAMRAREVTVPDLAGRSVNQASATLVAEGLPEALLDGSGALVTRPDLHGLEGFFAVAFERSA